VKRAYVVLAGLSFWAAQAVAQTPPHGPAELIGQARKARDQKDLEQAGQRGTTAGKKPPPDAVAVNPHAIDPHAAPTGATGAAPANPHVQNPHAGLNMGAMGDTGAEPSDDAPENPHAGLAAMDDAQGADDAPAAGPHAGMARTGEPPPVATERPDPALPVGTIRVHVIDASGASVPDAEINLGIMSSDSTHSSRSARTGADGTVLLSGLAAGDKQAYRVNVPYQGAKYSSTPFRLPPAGGYQVEIRRLPTTRDDHMVVLYLGATSLELKDERIKVVQEAQLLNIGGATYVFPEAGLLVPLPKGFMAVQTQESMTDQHVVEAKGEGLRVHGSLAPGQASLLWGFDIPLTSSEAVVPLEVPWLMFAYRVIADAPPGMTLEVTGMPEPMMHTDAGRKFWVTETQRKVGDPPLRSLTITLRGIPGPGPSRWIAAALALCAIAAGVVLSRGRQAARATFDRSDFEARKAELLERARELDAQHRAGETGPEYHQEQMTVLTDEVAALLFEQAEATKGSARKA
jgi:hypothetical protein